MKIRIEREKYLRTYFGPRRWKANGAEQAGFIALFLEGTQNNPLPIGTLRNGATYIVADNEYSAYTHRIFDKDGKRYIIGDVENYPVRFPLYRLVKA